MTATVELEVLKTLAGRLQWSRLVAGYDQTELAEAFGLDRKSIQRWEAGGNVKRHHLIAWASIVGVPVEWLEEGGDITFCAVPPTPPDQTEGQVTSSTAWNERRSPNSYLAPLEPLSNAA